MKISSIISSRDPKGIKIVDDVGAHIASFSIQHTNSKLRVEFTYMEGSETKSNIISYSGDVVDEAVLESPNTSDGDDFKSFQIVIAKKPSVLKRNPNSKRPIAP